MDIKIFEKKKTLGIQLSDFLKTTVYLDIASEPPRLVDFSVSQFVIQEKIKPVIRFDCSHGFLNIHRYYRDPNDRTDYPKQKPSVELYEECKQDVLQNWKKYRAHFLAFQDKD